MICYATRGMQRTSRRRAHALTWVFCLVLLSISGTANAQILGANYNGRARHADESLLTASQTSWVRGFYDVLEMTDASSLETHPDILGMRRSADAGQQLMVSFKWNFAGHNQRVPAPGTQEELALFGRAVETLDAIGRPVNTIVLGNEPMWETLNVDLRMSDGVVPYARFTERLRDYLDVHYGSSLGTEPEYYLGALNRLDLGTVQNRSIVQEFFRIARDNPDISGMDIHVHFDSTASARAQVEYARQQLGPDGNLLVTEFSPVWRYKAALDDPIGESPGGMQFAQEYGYSPSLEVDEYLTQAFANQVSRSEWSDFITSQPWFNENHVSDMHGMFREFEVSIATMGFSHPLSLRGFDATKSGYNPFNLNWLYIIGLIEGTDLLQAYNQPYMEDWLAAQSQLADLTRDGVIDVNDYVIIEENRALDLSALTNMEALALGDLNLDRQINGYDASRFASLYQSTYGVPFSLLGPADIDFSGAIDGDDWVILHSNLVRNLAAEGVDEAMWRSMGDLDLSGSVDRHDFRIFKNAYIATNGAAGWEAFASGSSLGVPEPRTIGTALLCLVALYTRRHVRARRYSMPSLAVRFRTQRATAFTAT